MHSHIHIHCLGTTNSKEDLLNMGGGGETCSKNGRCTMIGRQKSRFSTTSKDSTHQIFQKTEIFVISTINSQKKLYKLTIGMPVSFPHMGDRSVNYLPSCSHKIK